MSTEPAPDPVEDLLASCLERDEREWERAVEEACARHPEHAATLRRRFERLKDSAAPLRSEPGFEVMPERLGDFRLLERLGGGGMGVIYLAEQTSLKREVALKLIKPEHLYLQGARERFRREVEAVARCQHPGIVPVYAVGEAEGVPYFAMERVRGLSLGDVLMALEHRTPASLGPRDLLTLMRERRIPGLPEPDAVPAVFGASWVEVCCRLVRQAALALAHAHDQGILHRDIKPSNLMLVPDGQVRLVDFGCSFAVGAERMTRSGTELGSLPYMAPEQLAGAVPDRRTDVYGLGVTLYELLTLRAPYLEADVDATRRKIREGRPRPIRAHNPEVSWDVETVCLAAMDRDPARRYASMRDLAADLTRVLEHRPITARRPGPALRARRFVQRHPTLSVALALGTALLVLGPLALWLQAKGHAERLGTALADVERLSDERVLEDLIREEEELWPAVPERVAGEHGMDAWLDRATRLRERSVGHERDLSELRKRALPLTPAEAAADARRKLDETAESDRLLARWEEIRKDPSKWSQAAMGEIAFRTRALRFSLATGRYTFGFARPEDRWRHDKLAGLIAGIRGLSELQVKEVTERREIALRIAQRSLIEPKELWAAAIAEVRADPRYRGLQLAPQRGLVPLGRDPVSGLFEFAHVQSGDVPRRNPRTGKLQTDADKADNMCVIFVLLPGGKCTTGASRIVSGAPGGGGHPDPGALDDEGPPVEVELDPFFVAKHEMTQGQWWMCFSRDPASLRVNSEAGGGYVTYRHPVESVSWRDASLAMARLELELPTEVQWEYAARGGTRTPWPQGHALDDLDGFANLRDGDRWADTSPVDQFPANAFGLHDVVGNVAEWCRDRYEPFATPPRKGDGLRESGGMALRTLRGGGFLDQPADARVAHRRKEDESNRLTWVGVRPVRAVR